MLKIDKKKSSGASKKATKKRAAEADPKGKKKPNLKEPSRTIAMWLLLALAVVFGLRLLQGVDETREQTLTYTQFQALIASTDVKIVKMDVSLKGINRAVLRGEVTDPGALVKVTQKQAGGVKVFTVILPFLESSMLKEWDNRSIPYSFLPEKFNWGEMLWSNLF